MQGGAQGLCAGRITGLCLGGCAWGEERAAPAAAAEQQQLTCFGRFELGLQPSDLVGLDGRSLRAHVHLALLQRLRGDPLDRAHQALPGVLGQAATSQDLRPGLAFDQVNDELLEIEEHGVYTAMHS